MLRAVLPRLGLILLTFTTTQAQGIRGVTRRTPTQEFQDPPRRFFEAAGINITGGTTRPVPPGSPAFAGSTPPVAVPSRPVARPMLSNKTPPQRVQARPYVLGPTSNPNPATNRPYLAATPPSRPLGRTAPSPTSAHPTHPPTLRPNTTITPSPPPPLPSPAQTSPTRP